MVDRDGIIAELNAGTPLHRIVLATNVNRYALERLARAQGLVLDPETDVASPIPPEVDRPTPTTQAGVVRAWARAHGYDVKGVGVLPLPVVAAYEAAHRG